MVNGESKKSGFVRLGKRGIVYGKIYLGVSGFGDKNVRFVCIYFHSVELTPIADGVYILLGFAS